MAMPVLTKLNCNQVWYFYCFLSFFADCWDGSLAYDFVQSRGGCNNSVENRSSFRHPPGSDHPASFLGTGRGI
ncbi:hypothetical protein L6164_019379 [Bauhinia variegata]|uniref:Uncharacterized protein n=1 Tax=Bauhinia variegata TaxID=167791 RepID=A0ACB9MT66_BAUVA|nr:hypothetical protein L6164_019379 [Bauhinia variegata]